MIQLKIKVFWPDAKPRSIIDFGENWSNTSKSVPTWLSRYPIRLQWTAIRSGIDVVRLIKRHREAINELLWKSNEQMPNGDGAQNYGTEYSP